jgi:hypothetical protein
MLANVCFLLYNTHIIFILLGYRARRARKSTVFFEVLCEVKDPAIGLATISSPFSGAGALRVVYAPETQRNPTLVTGGLRSETARGRENPNASTGPMSRPVAGKEPNQLRPKRQSGQGLQLDAQQAQGRCYSPRRAAAAHSSAALSSARAYWRM